MAPSADRRRRAIAAASAVALVALLALVLILTQGGGGGQRSPAIRSTGLPPARGKVRPPPLRRGPRAQPAPRTEQLGVNAGLLFDSRTYRQPQIDVQLAALARTGATLVRNDAPWEATEPSPPVPGVPRYDWRFDDRVAASLAAHRLRWLPVIDYSPRWARSIRGVDHSPPVSAVAYAAYAGALAARYGVGGSFWLLHPRLPAEPVTTYEIWNEPDSSFFWKLRPDPGVYARLYERARAAITSVQPQARVIIGGLTRPRKFLPALLRAEPRLQGHIDGVGIHPYGHDPQKVLARVRRARLTLRSLGLARVPLYVTEFGWTTRPAHTFGFAPASLRPRLIYLTMAALRHTDCNLAAMLLYAWSTPERNPTTGQDWFGIDPPRARPSPAVRAFTRALRTGTPSARRLCAAP